VQESDFVRIAVDKSVISWKAGQGLAPTIQNDDKKRRDYEAIERLFELQKECRVVLVAVDTVGHEARRTSNESERTKQLETLNLCKEKSNLARFDKLTPSRRAATGESGIDLGEGAYWVTKDNMRRIEEYVEIGRNSKDQADLEVLATAAIAGVRRFMTVDYRLLDKSYIRKFVREKDGISMYRPSEILMLIDISPRESEE
jgi:hypothetical protein